MFVTTPLLLKLALPEQALIELAKQKPQKEWKTITTSIASFMLEKQRPTYVHHLWK